MTEEEEDIGDVDPTELHKALGAQGQWKIEDEPPPEKGYDHWVAVLRAGDPEACAEAVDALSEMGPDVLVRLVTLLDDPNADLVVDVKKTIKLIEDTLP